MDHRVDLSQYERVNSDFSVKKEKISVVYIDISNLSDRKQFIICCFAVFILYLFYGYLQELIFTLEGFKPFGWYLTLVQFAFYSVFAYLETLFRSNDERKIPMKIYVLLAFLTLGTIGLSNYSLFYLNYPTQVRIFSKSIHMNGIRCVTWVEHAADTVSYCGCMIEKAEALDYLQDLVIFKCCKLIPVMIGSILIQNKKYKPLDFAAAVFMCIGLSYFTLADSHVSPNFSGFGVGVISCALLCDAAIGNVQEKSMNTYNASNHEVVLYSYFLGFLYLAVIMLLSGELWRGFSFCSEKPEIYGLAFLFSVSGYLGVQVVLSLVRKSGALIAVTVTTFRKAVSIVISFVLFSKPFTIHYLWGGLLVVVGIYLNLLSKNPSSRPKLHCFRFMDNSKKIEMTV